MAEKHYEPQKKVEPIDGLDAKRQVQLDTGIDSTSNVEAMQKVKFDEALDKVNPSKNPPIVQAIADTSVEASAKPSLMDVARAQSIQSTRPVPTVEDIQNQALELRNAFQKPRATIMGVPSDMAVRPADLTSMQKHIEHADSSLKEATSAVRGVEVGSLAPPSTTEKPPMVKFLKFLTDGDNRVSTIIDDISKLDLKGQKMSPQLLIAVQIKLGFVQQELEFFTNVLNKSLESTKTIMNVQI